jgi:hypothetical protein
MFGDGVIKVRPIREDVAGLKQTLQYGADYDYA